MRSTEYEEAVLLRLQTLERRHRRMMALIALLVAVLLWTEMAPRETLRARRFAMVDADGREAGFWGVGQAGPIFVLRDTTGVWRGWLQVTEEGSFLRLSGPTNDTASVLGTTGGVPHLELLDDAGGARVVVASEGGEPSIDLIGPDDRTRHLRLQARADPDGP